MSHRISKDFTYFDNASHSASQLEPTLTYNASHSASQYRITNDFTYVNNASHSMLKTRAAICEYREHMNLYRVPRPSSCQSRLCVGFTVRFLHVSSCLLAPHPVYSFSVRFSPFSPSHYSVKTKCPLSLYSSIAFSIRSLPLLR